LRVDQGRFDYDILFTLKDLVLFFFL
jgi:hypothetical protein